MSETTYLLDVNVLIALIDPVHLQHSAAHAWFLDEGHRSWSTCPITENGVVRIVGHARYPNTLGNPLAVLGTMRKFCALPGYMFWPDEISLLDPARIDAGRLLHASQVTDSYLLSLAVSRNGRLASFDRRLVADAVPGGRQGLCLLN